MNCQEALNLLYDIIDRQASEIDTEQVQEHLKTCQHCFEIYKVEGAVNEFIRASVKNDKNEIQIENLRLKIIHKLDAIDIDGPGSEDSLQNNPGETVPDVSAQLSPDVKKKTSLKITRLLAIAATIVVVISAGFIASKYLQHQKTFLPMEQAHLEVNANLANFTDQTNFQSALATAADDWQFELNPQVNNFNLVGGKMTTIDGLEMCQFVYENNNRYISVFVVPADKFTIPDNLPVHQAASGGLTLFDHNCRGCHLVYHKYQNCVVITASEDHAYDLLNFIPDKGIA